MNERGKAGFLKLRAKAPFALLMFSWLVSGAIPGVSLAAGPEVRPAPPSVNRPPVAAPQMVGVRQPGSARKAAKIKLHHNAKGEYTWDISGDNVEEILRIDRRLRKAMDAQE